jgi:hypothetical protein
MRICNEELKTVMHDEDAYLRVLKSNYGMELKIEYNKEDCCGKETLRKK